MQTLSAEQNKSSPPQASRSSAATEGGTSAPGLKEHAPPEGDTSRRADGKPLALTERDEARFKAKVALPDENGCMRWLGYIREDGYASFYLAGRQVLVHRVGYTLANGPIPDGLDVDHVKANGCRHRDCSAPAHLEAVTPLENHRRGEAGVNMRSKTHCPQGHAYSGENLYINPSSGARQCRICQREADRRYRERRRAKSQC
ncbi:HNH endonuclease signature motif containing protein [Streptomyces nodosus]|uniref:HNH endonuclease signature motif containing protein n=1 Tax=Streptomyces nodosus TaxID=40318 RepID=UPI003451BE1B